MKTTKTRHQHWLVAGAFAIASFVSVSTAGGQCPPSYSVCAHGTGKSLLLIKDKSPAGPSAKDKLIWKWLKPPVSVTQLTFGDPVSGGTDYTLCLYANPGIGTGTTVATVPGGGTCAGKPCWKAISTKGWKYKDKDLNNDGVKKIIMKGGPASKIVFKAKDGGLPIPSLPLDVTPNGLAIQLRPSNTPPGECFQTIFSSSHVIKNDATQFKAKRP